MNNGSIRASLVICATILLTAGIYFASSVFAPLTFALLVLALVWPFQEWLEEHGIFVAGVISERFDVAWLIRLFQEVLAFVFLMMLLLEVKEFSRKIGSLGKGVGPKLVEAGVETAVLIRRYMLVRTLLSIITGLAVWGFALLMGVEPASAWGLLAFTLNYIPFLGSFVATLLPGLFALAQLDSWSTIVVVIIGLACIQFLLGNYIEPLVAGAALSISPFAVVFAVFFWGFLWGIPGAFIGVPIMIAAITICAKFASSRWVATLLSGVPPDLTARKR